jgi:hypothetical protein
VNIQTILLCEADSGNKKPAMPVSMRVLRGAAVLEYNVVVPGAGIEHSYEI